MRNIQCKNCFFFKPEWCPKKKDSTDPDLIRDCQYYRTKTNADRIRSMTDEKLAKFLCDVNHECYQCPAEDLCTNGSNGMIKWLKEEVTT